ncbi:hypothetical protein ABZS66_31545 [Dactylosporangium sp. NPDC005572]|uniref:hypothetical protein n=1 Tax=Dactylosporangium sp. NPDC005572 TaxID=3156889 RepID=UPI0033BBB424
MTTSHQPGRPDEARDDDRTLDPGEIVTVNSDHDAHRNTPRNQAFVIIDSFWHPKYAMAALGGDGLEWRNQPRAWLQPVSPTQLRQARNPDGDIIYVVD